MSLQIKPEENCRWDLVSLGEVMLRFDPGDRRVWTARTFDVSEGGGEYNVARGLKRCFGLNTAIVTALADNPVGHLVEDLMYQGGVDQQFVRWVPYDGVGRTVRNGLNFTERGYGVRAALEMLDRQDRPTALFCVTDAFAFAALDAATQLGLRVPEELSIVGFDDSGPSRWAFVNLTTVHQPIAEMSYEAVDRLAGRIEGGPPSQTRKPVFPVRLEIRGTTAPPPQAVLRPPLRSSV